jgi:hypothetical protein
MINRLFLVVEIVLGFLSYDKFAQYSPIGNNAKDPKSYSCVQYSILR